jgi:hypothetical protein
MEKEMATPDYYPLSLNSLLNACNQKSNRHPVVSFDEETVSQALQELMERKLVRQSNVSRVPKYEQIFSNNLNLISREEAIICILLVRGPQTVGEIRGRTDRLYSFANLEEVQETISSLEDNGLVTKLPRQPGRKECRYSHLLSGPQDIHDENSSNPESNTVIVRKKDDRLSELQQEVDKLRQELHDLQQEFAAFKSQFE